MAGTSSPTVAPPAAASGWQFEDTGAPATPAPDAQTAPAASSPAASGWQFEDTGQPATSATPQTALGAINSGAQAINSGLVSGAISTVGLPIDAAEDAYTLAKSGLARGIGALYSATGHPVPDALSAAAANTGSATPFSDAVRGLITRLGGGSLVNLQNPTTVNRYLNAAGQGAGGAVTGGLTGVAAEGAGLVKGVGSAAPGVGAALSGAAVGAGQQAIADAGLPLPVQVGAGILAGHVAGSLGSGEAAAVEPKATVPSTPAEISGAADRVLAKPAMGEAPPLASGPAEVVEHGTPSAAPIAPASAEPVALNSQTATDRAGVLRTVLGPNTQVRASALTGDAQGASDDFQTSKMTDDEVQPLRAAVANERSGLSDYAADTVTQNGGNLGNDQAALYQRGNDIQAAPNAYREFLNGQIKSLYQAASDKAAGKPIALNGFSNFLNSNNADFLATTDGKQLLEGVQARARDLGLFNGNATVQQAESMRQYLGNAWTPRTNHLIGAMKDAIDDDVTQSAGSDIYGAGRTIRALRATQLDNPKGVSALLAPTDSLGINRTVPLENIPRYVENTPLDQFNHLADVTDQAARAPDPDVQAAAVQTRNAIKSQFANGVHAAGTSTAGMWNQRAVGKYLDAHGAQMARVFSPDELGRFKNLRAAGHILQIDRSYPGAAVQAHNLVTRGILTGIEKGAEALGAHVGNLPGWLVGKAASGAASKLKGGALRSAVAKRLVTL